MILLYNHESSTGSLFMHETLLVKSQACRRRGRRKRATNIAYKNVTMAPRNIWMVAMDSPVFDYVVFYFLLNNIHGGQWPEGLPRYLNPCTNWPLDSLSRFTLKLNTSSARWEASQQESRIGKISWKQGRKVVMCKVVFKWRPTLF